MNIECVSVQQEPISAEFLFKSINNYIQSSNFPKKLLVKKLDMYSTQYKEKLKTLTALDEKLKESCETTGKGIADLKRKNQALLSSVLGE